MFLNSVSQPLREKTFVHEVVNLGYDELPTKEVNGKRQYILPNGESYPSITTVLGHGKNEFIEAWKRRVGNKEAERISRVACSRGTSLHLLVERYIRNDEQVFQGDEMPDALAMFRALLPEINNRIGSVFLQEKTLYSTHLRVAGRTDLIAEFDGRLSVIDIKSSGRVKSKRDISNYFIQEAAYAIMFEERTGMPVDRLVTLMAVDGRKEPLVFVEKRDNWTDGLLKAIHAYEKAVGSK